MTPASNPSPASRRDFLKTSALAAGTATAALSGGAFAAGSDTLKIALIGCGGRGTGAALNALNADRAVKLVALADAFPDRLQTSLNQLKKAAPGKVEVSPDSCFSGFDAYQKVLASDVQVVILATPPGFRPLHLKTAVEAGKHVFAEKPFAVDAPGVRSVIASAEAARKKGLCLMSGFCYRHDAAKRETVKRIHDGAIGDIVAIQANYNTGPIWHRGENPKWSEMEYQMRNWYYFTWLSGDFNVEQHVHNLDKAAWVLKGEMPIAAVGLGGRQQRTDKKFGNIYDHFGVVYEYANGTKLFSYCRQMQNAAHDISDQIMGTKGLCQLMQHTIAAGAQKWAYEGDEPNMYQVEHDELFAAIRAGKTVNDGVSAAQSTLMAILGRMAAYTGKRVTWKEALASKEDLTPAKYEWGSNPVPPVAVPGVTKFV